VPAGPTFSIGGERAIASRLSSCPGRFAPELVGETQRPRHQGVAGPKERSLDGSFYALVDRVRSARQIFGKPAKEVAPNFVIAAIARDGRNARRIVLAVIKPASLVEEDSGVEVKLRKEGLVLVHL
jgi:hypothetical protein